jgi:ElaB/YqjD/DUF883 family membrane-anchored ribosome-binding protein
MTQLPSPQNTSGVADGIAHAAEHAQASVQTYAHHTPDNIASALQSLSHDVAPKLHHIADQMGTLSRQGAQAVGSGAHYLSDRAHHVADSTRGYIRKEPATAVLLAAGLGALLVAVWVAVKPGRPR